MKKLFPLFLIIVFQSMILTSLNGQCDPSFTTTVDCNCVTFTPTFIDPNCTYSWDFGLENATSDEMTPTYCYSFTGNDTSSINVNLSIECLGGAISCDSSINIEILQIPDAELDPLNAAGWLNCVADINNPDFTILVDNISTTSSTNSQYIIEWGDSTLINGIMVANIDTFGSNFMDTTHLYQELLSYNVTITVVGQNGCIASNTYDFINSAANPDIGLELDGTSNECIGYTGTFIISNTEDNPPFTTYIVRVDNGLNDSIVFNHPPPDTFQYTFNTGSCFDTTIISSETYPHSFSISITAITENCGASTAAVGPIRIDEPPLADFSITPQTTQCAPSDTFYISNESIPGNYNLIGDNDCSDSTWYYWAISPNANYTLTTGMLGLYNDIPAGASQGSSDGISLVFDTPGEYEISLVAQSRLGSVCDTSMMVQSICVLPQPIASFTPSILIDCAPASINFTNTSNTIGSCAAATYNWSVDFIESECGLDSAYEITNNDPLAPIILFNASGQYAVQLQVINQCDTSYYEEIITIAQASVIEINPIENACLSTLINPSFENITECYAPAVCVWYFPNPIDPTLTDTVIGCTPPAISYNSVGTYTIAVEVTNDCGTSIDTESFTLFALPAIPDIMTNSPLCAEQDLCFEVSNLAPNQIIEWTGPQAWSSNALNDCITNTSQIDDGLYQLSITDTITGCINDTLINVEIIGLPNINVVPEDPSICIGDTITIMVSGANQYTWSPSLGLSSTSGATVEAFPLVTTTYILTSLNTVTGCSSIDSIEVIVNPLPIVEAGIDTFSCTGSDLQLGGTPIGGVWTNEQGEIITNGIFNESIPGEYTLTYSFIDNNFCSNQDALIVCVINNPISSFLLDNTVACTNTIIQTTNTSNTLNDCLASTYTWSVSFDGADCHEDSTGWAFSTGHANSISPAFSFSLSGVYTIQLEVANSCDTVYSNQTVTIGAAPEVMIDSIDLLCEQFSIQPSASIQACNSSVQTYSWSFPGADIPFFEGLQTPVLTYPNTGIYTISLTITNSCGSSTDNYTFEIFDLPIVSASNSSPLCGGETLQLTSTSANAVSYQWQGPANFNSIEANPIILNTATNQAGIYYLTITDSNGCMNIDSTEVIILDDPILLVTATNAEFCLGDSTTLSVMGADTYIWSPSSGLNMTTGNTVIASPINSTVYTVIGTNTNTGCMSADTIEVIVNPLPQVEAGEHTLSCTNSDLQLIGSPEGGIWTDDQGNIIPNGIFNTSVADSYLLYYSYMDDNDCENQDSLIACVINNPIADFQLDSTVACIGATIQTTNTSNTLNDCQDPTYIWSVFFDGADCHMDSTGWFFNTGNENSIDPSFSFTLSGIYTIQLEIANSCDTVQSSQMVTIGDAPEVMIDSLDLLCENFTIQASATTRNCNSPNQSYTWSFPGADIPTFDGLVAPPITYPTVGVYTISLTVVNACGSTTDHYTFEIFSLPEVAISNNSPICADETLQLNGLAPTAILYDWSGPNFSSGIANPIINNIDTNQAGDYALTVTDANGCTNSDTTIVSIWSLPEVDILAENAAICIGDSTMLYISADSLYTYLWTPPLNLNTTMGDTVIAFPNSNTNYIVTSTNGITGCMNLDTFELIVNPLPIVEAGIAQIACAGNNHQLGGFPSGGDWTDEMGNIITNGLFNEPLPSVYSVYYTFTDSESCVNSDSTEVCVQSNPLAGFDIDNTEGCQELLVNLVNNSNTLSDCNAAIYTWNVLFNSADCHTDSTGWEFITGGPNSIDASISFYLSGNYTIELLVSNSCGINSFSQNIIVGDRPSITLPELIDLCDEYSIGPIHPEILACNNSISQALWTIEPDANISTWEGDTLPSLTFQDPGIKTIILSVSNACGTISDSLSFEIFDLPTISADNNGPLCEGEDLQLSAVSNGTDFFWTGPNNFTSIIQNPVITNIELGNEGSYIVIVSDDVTGCTNQDTTTLSINLLPLVDAGANMEECPIDTIIQLEGTPVGGVWSGIGVSPDGIFNPGLQTPGDYTLSYTYIDSLTLCSASNELIFTVHPLALQEVYEDVLCADEFIIRNGTRYDIDHPSGVEYYMSPITNCDSLIEQISLSFWELNADISTEMPTCFGEEDGAIILELVNGGTPPYTLTVEGSPSYISSTFPFIIPRLGAGVYDVEIVDAQGCTITETDILVESPHELKLELGEDQLIELGDSVQLDALITPFVFDPYIYWNPLDGTLSGCDTCANPYARPFQTTTYTARYLDEMGCEAKDNITLFVDQSIRVFIPNLFSPNDDGNNDIFYIQADETYLRIINEFYVYDRWGEVVYQGHNFQPNDPAYGWDGYLKGRPMNPAVFVYWARVELVNGRTEIIKGDVTLIR